MICGSRGGGDDEPFTVTVYLYVFFPDPCVEFLSLQKNISPPASTMHMNSSAGGRGFVTNEMPFVGNVYPGVTMPQKITSLCPGTSISGMA